MDDIIPADFRPDEGQQEKRGLRQALSKVFFSAMALLMVLLFVVYLFPGDSLSTIIGRQVASSNINERYEIPLKWGGNVVLAPAAYGELLQIWEDEQDHEFKACLLGRKEGTDYVVTGIAKPHIFAQDVFSVTAAVCGNDTIIPLHSHPVQRCVPSQQDLQSQAAFRVVNQESIGGIMCEKTRFTFYGK